MDHPKRITKMGGSRWGHGNISNPKSPRPVTKRRETKVGDLSGEWKGEFARQGEWVLKKTCNKNALIRGGGGG